MTNIVFIAVLCAALCHAGWNALIKVGLEPLSATTLIAIGSALVAIPFLPFVGLPLPAAWPWLIASALIHVVYFAALIEAYRAGDLGQVYPIARGAAPLMTATATTFVLGEHLTLMAWGGIVALVAGVVLLSARGGRDLVTIDRRAVGFALLTALTICIYSVVDGIGARSAGNPASYPLWLFVANAAALLPYAYWRGGRAIVPAMQGFWLRGLIGGAMQLFSYGTVLWAMTLAPIAIVATLRETSVLFGAIIAVVWLGEPLRATRIVAALLILSGLVLIRLQ